jgi:ABC-2 type transport system permease protein
MMKILAIGWKDLRLVLRDRAALILMLAAPFALTLGMGFVSGRFSGMDATTGLSDIPVVIVNDDDGPLGEALMDVLNSSDLADLLAPVSVADEADARQRVDDDEAAAAVIILAGFSAGALPNPATGVSGEAVSIELYANPNRPVSAGVAQTVVERFLGEVETGQVGATVTLAQLLAAGLLSPQEAAEAAPEIAARLVGGEGNPDQISLNRVSTEGERQAFDILAFFAPGMAMMFLMYTVAYGGRSVLAERSDGTLPRLMTTPTSAAQVLGGKVFGIFLTGAAQVGVLVLASSVFFGLRWGSPLAVAALVAAVALAATGWGLMLAALARSPAQVGSLGAAMMILFGILGGSFVPAGNFPGWLAVLSKLTPNAWGLEGFTALARGGDLAAIALPLAALLAMAAVLFGIAVPVFQRSELSRVG